MVPHLHALFPCSTLHFVTKKDPCSDGCSQGGPRAEGYACAALGRSSSTEFQPMRQWLFVFVAFCLLLPSPVMAADEPLWDELKRRIKSPVFNIGALIQVVGSYENDRPIPPRNGFVLANSRLRVNGELDGNWGYYVQFSLTKAPAFLDANIHLAPWGPWADFKAGAFKTPFSAEFLISASKTDFVNRAQVVTALSAGRQVGFQCSGSDRRRLWLRLGRVQWQRTEDHQRR
jgi:hypothetical protein